VICLVSGNDRTYSEIEKNGFTLIPKNDELTEENYLLSSIHEISPSLLFIDKIYPYSKDFISTLNETSTTFLFHNICEGIYSAHTFILPSVHTDLNRIDMTLLENNGTRFFHGEQYIVLNENVLKYKQKRIDSGIVDKKICITTGGSDPQGILVEILKRLMKEDLFEYKIIALTGSAFSYSKEIHEMGPFLPEFICVKEFTFNEIANAMCVVSTFGVTTYELLYLGIPVLSFGHAPENALGSQLLESRYHAISHLGLFSELSEESFSKNFIDFIKNYSLFELLSKAGSALIDGKGADRIAEIIALSLK
jgi:spore coat polysaccharide biosynthesis predicted glycosyltransferase SpsG